MHVRFARYCALIPTESLSRHGSPPWAISWARRRGQTLFAALSLHHRVVLPTTNLDTTGDGTDLDMVRALPGGVELAVLSNSFGLGGHSVIVALRYV